MGVRFIPAQVMDSLEAIAEHLEFVTQDDRPLVGIYCKETEEGKIQVKLSLKEHEDRYNNVVRVASQGNPSIPVECGDDSEPC